MKNLKLICCVCLFLMLMSCGDGSPEVKPLSMGEKIELKDVNVSLVSLETTKAIQSKDGRIIKAEDGKIIYIATFELENKTAETIYASDFGGGLYKKGSVKGDATVSTEIPGVMLSADIADEGAVTSIAEVEANQTVRVQNFYYGEEGAEYEMKIGERFSWKNLHLAVADNIAKERQAATRPAHLIDFAGLFEGTTESTAAALAKYGIESGSEVEDQMLGILLEEGEVVSEKEGCAYMTFKAGVTQREYDICFNEGGTQITNITFRGITQGVMR